MYINFEFEFYYVPHVSIHSKVSFFLVEMVKFELLCLLQLALLYVSVVKEHLLLSSTATLVIVKTLGYILQITHRYESA